jgi:N-sulfoglucosamine sulfohydrolase
MKTPILGLIRLTLASGLLAVCTAWSAERNVVLIITDDQSPTLGCYGDPVAKTPHVDSLAADGVIFTRAYATVASCSASRSAVLSGLYSHRNGQYGHTHAEHHFVSFPDIQPLTLPQALARAEYRTGHVGKFHVAPEETYRFGNYFQADERNPVAMAEAVRGFIAGDRDRPFFLYFAPGDPHRSGAVNRSAPVKHAPDLFGNPKPGQTMPGVTTVVYDPAKVAVPPFLPDTPETRAELAEYYQSVARVDQGVGRLLEILRSEGLMERTMIIFTSDHGMAFAGAKTTVYEAGLSVPFVVRDPYQQRRGLKTDALISLVDMTPSILDFAGALDRTHNRPRDWTSQPAATRDAYNKYHGRSWFPLLAEPAGGIHDVLLGSHTFHEIQMYYPMRAVWDDRYRLVWNLAHPLPFPMASDLLASATWQAQRGVDPATPYGYKTVGEIMKRPEFELYDVSDCRHERRNLANDPAYAAVLARYLAQLRQKCVETGDPWLKEEQP